VGAGIVVGNGECACLSFDGVLLGVLGPANWMGDTRVDLNVSSRVSTSSSSCDSTSMTPHAGECRTGEIRLGLAVPRRCELLLAPGVDVIPPARIINFFQYSELYAASRASRSSASDVSTISSAIMERFDCMSHSRERDHSLLCSAKYYCCWQGLPSSTVCPFNSTLMLSLTKFNDNQRLFQLTNVSVDVHVVSLKHM
jgi:hypothetical protein